MSDNDIIHKFEVNANTMTEQFVVELPAFAEVIHAEEQFQGLVAIWFRFRESDLRTKAKRTFYLVPTGQPFARHAKYLKTILLYDGRLVLHLLEASRI